MNYKSFENFVHNCRSGYLNPWDTFCLWLCIMGMKQCTEKKTSLRKYLMNCLKPEGFNKRDIGDIVTYVELDGKI
jgi:hypothetical protein